MWEQHTKSAGGEDDHRKFRRWPPVAAAVRIGSGAFAIAPVKNGQVTLTLPEGTARYGIAYVCPPPPFDFIASVNEFVIEATVEDGLAFTLSCSVPARQDRATVTVSVDASGIPDAPLYCSP